MRRKIVICVFSFAAAAAAYLYQEKKTARDDDEMKSFGKGQEILGRRRSRALLLLHCKSFWRASVYTLLLWRVCDIVVEFELHLMIIRLRERTTKKNTFSRRLREAQKIQKCV